MQGREEETLFPIESHLSKVLHFLPSGVDVSAMGLELMYPHHVRLELLPVMSRRLQVMWSITQAAKLCLSMGL